MCQTRKVGNIRNILGGEGRQMRVLKREKEKKNAFQTGQKLMDMGGGNTFSPRPYIKTESFGREWWE